LKQKASLIEDAIHLTVKFRSYSRGTASADYFGSFDLFSFQQDCCAWSWSGTAFAARNFGENCKTLDDLQKSRRADRVRDLICRELSSQLC
jgi:hypothetical protein